MSLIAHYKLDGDLTDSSGNGNDLTQSTISTDFVSGKIKSCFNIKTRFNSVGLLAYPLDYDLNLYNESISFWMKCDFVLADDTGGGFGNWIFQWGNYYTQNSGGIGAQAGEIYTYIKGSTNTGWSASGSSTLANNIYNTGGWIHYTIIFEGNNTIVFYMNGQEVMKKTIADGFIGYTGNIMYFGNSMLAMVDDVRIYDHALSEKEVKELAKAKILHYTFDEFQEPTENVATGALSFYTPYNVLTARDGQDLTITMVNGGAQYLTFGNGVDYNGKIISISGRLYKNGIPHSLPGDRANTYHTVPALVWNFNVDGNGKFEIVENCSASSGWIFHTAAGTTGTDIITIKDFQVELKDHATPFVNGTRTGSVSDNSGYDNHAELELATTPQWTEDSKIGSGAYKFNGTNSLTTNKLFFDNVNQEWTASGWCKLENNTVAQVFNNFNSGNRIIHSSLKALLYANSGANDHYVYSVSSMPLGEWFHIAFVYRTSDLTCKIYLNGNLDASSYNYSSSDLPSGFSSSTIFGQGVIGLMDDVRIYATALSADDIKELYQTRASIDNKGNLFCGGINEYSNWDKPIINESGIYSINTFNEVGLPIRYIRDSMVGSSANSSNHWVEIQAFNSSDNNIALNKTAVNSILTDGSTNSSPYYSGGPATVDLGDIYTIMYLKIWHYWADARTYYKIKTEVSADNINWITVFDSDKDGEYVETSEGKEIILYPNKASIRETGEVFVREINEV